MKSRRQNILDSLVTIVTGLALVKTIALNNHIPQDLAVENFPAVFIYSGPDRQGKGQRSGESETFVWDIEILCMTQDLVPGEDSDIENLVAEVHRAIMADTTINQEVDIIHRIGSDPDRSFDLSGLKTSNSLVYEVIYEQNTGEI